tara:strand:- start:19 stop:405 length:387 start_codon:yes stop_codon:yes gene_type:complete
MSAIHKIPDISNITKSNIPYSHIVRAGDFLYISGQAGIDYNTGKLVGDEFDLQAKQAFQNISILLEHSGSDMSKVIKTTVWLCDTNNFEKLNELYTEFFPNNPPARSTPIVGLPLKELHISVECIAIT